VTSKDFDENITPYLHLLVAHIPALMDEELNLAKFSQQAAEHSIQQIKSTFLRQTAHQIKNNTNSPALHRVLRLERMRLRNRESTPRSVKRMKTRKDKGTKRIAKQK